MMTSSRATISGIENHQPQTGEMYFLLCNEEENESRRGDKFEHGEKLAA